MFNRLVLRSSTVLIIGWMLAGVNTGAAQKPKSDSELDGQVESFLEEHQDKWKDWNVPESDGKALYDLIIENNYSSALEIGTSTGRSAIWIAWALSKTDGKLITIEINEERYNKALKNFEKAGVAPYIDARLANAHDLVPQLKGPFDFIFLDADKPWYKYYVNNLLPKLKTGGCIAAHNVLNTWMSGINEYMDYIKSLPNMKTEIIRSSSAGISVSFKRPE